MSVQMKYDYKEALERENVQQTIIDDLRNSNISGLPNSITDQQLLLFYRACEYDFEETRNVIKNYYEHKRKTLEHFANRYPEAPEIQQCLENQ